MGARRSDCTIVVVDQDPDAVAASVRVLTAAGYKVTGVASFSEARHLLNLQQPDVLIADVRLEAFNGLHLALERHFQTPGKPSIITNSSRDRVLEEQARRIGAVYVVKPLEAATLRTLVASVLLARTEPATERRHWPRKTTAGSLHAQIAHVAVTVTDLSYEGLRVERRASPALWRPPHHSRSQFRPSLCR